MFETAALPEHVRVVDVHDGSALLVCRSPKHTTPRDYVSRPGPNGAACPLCGLIDMYRADVPVNGDAA